MATKGETGRAKDKQNNFNVIYGGRGEVLNVLNVGGVSIMSGNRAPFSKGMRVDW